MVHYFTSSRARIGPLQKYISDGTQAAESSYARLPISRRLFGAPLCLQLGEYSHLFIFIDQSIDTRKGSSIKDIPLLIRTRLMCCRNNKCTVIPDCDGDSVDVVLAASIKHWSKCVLRKCYFLQLQ